MMPHINEDIIRVKLKEVRVKVKNWGGSNKKDPTVDNVTIPQLLNQIEDLLDDRPRPLYMANEEVQAIVANPYVSPEDLVKHCLSNPQYLEEWLRAKGKALAGVSNDCSQCVIAAYLQESLTDTNWEFQYLNVSYSHAWLCIEKYEASIKLPEWANKFILAIDAHQNYCQSGRQRQRIVSGNLAANILKVTLAAGVE